MHRVLERGGAPARWESLLVAGLTCCALLLRPSLGRAEDAELTARGLSASEIARLADQLAVAPRRAAAVQALTELHAESLPGIAARLTALRRSRPDPEQAKTVFTAFRHAVGSRRGDDVVDFASGVLPALNDHCDPVRVAIAEPLLLLRALERIAPTEPAAGLRMADVLTLDPEGVWDSELRLARDRGGLPLLPALIALRSHADPRVRAWAQAGVHALGMEDPAVATVQTDAHLTAAVIHAYTEPLEYAAMPVLVRLVGANKLEVREAARAAVARFGKNAIWQLRQLYEEVNGKSADRRWDAARTARELYAAFDRSEREQAETELARGMSLFVAGKLDDMQHVYDALLAQFPRFEQRSKMAAGYAALGDARLAQDELETARDAYARALRLAPEADDAPRLRGKLAFADAELSLSEGVVDLPGYDRALQHDPQLHAAADIRDRLSGAHAARERRTKRLAAAAAIALLITTLALLLRGRRDASVQADAGTTVPPASPVS